MFFSFDTPSFLGPRHCGQESACTIGETINKNVNENRVRRMGIGWGSSGGILKPELEAKCLGLRSVFRVHDSYGSVPNLLAIRTGNLLILVDTRCGRKRVAPFVFCNLRGFVQAGLESEAVFGKNRHGLE